MKATFPSNMTGSPILEPDGCATSRVDRGDSRQGTHASRRCLARLRKNKLAMAGLIWIIIVILIAASAGLWVPRYFGSPTAIDSTTVVGALSALPRSAHPFGTDKLGRDILSRTIYGARASLSWGWWRCFIMLVIGLVAGSCRRPTTAAGGIAS